MSNQAPHRIAFPDDRKVKCLVSNRWIQFPLCADGFSEGTFICVDLMTLNADDKPRKLCELVLSKEDILAMLERLPVTQRDSA